MRKGGVLGKRPLLGKHAQDKNIPRKAKGGTTVTGEWRSKQIMDLVKLQIGTHIDWSPCYELRIGHGWMSHLCKETPPSQKLQQNQMCNAGTIACVGQQEHSKGKA